MFDPSTNPNALPAFAPLPNQPALLYLSSIFNNPPHFKKGEADQNRTYMEDGQKMRQTVLEYGSTKKVKFTITSIYRSKQRRHHSKMSGTNKNIVFLEQKVNQSSTKKTIPTELIIDLDEMVELGLYSSKDAAYKGLSDAVELLERISIAQINKKEFVEFEGVLFSNCRRENGMAIIDVNESIVKKINKVFTYFPVWGYQLSGNSFGLLEYTFRLLRQYAEDVVESGSFTIRIETVCNQLGLPTVDDVRENNHRKYKDAICDPLIKAIAQINETEERFRKKSKNYFIDGCFRIEMIAADPNKIDQWIQGVVVIHADGEYVKNLKTIAEGKALYRKKRKEKLIKLKAERDAKQAFYKGEEA